MLAPKLVVATITYFTRPTINAFTRAISDVDLAKVSALTHDT